MKLILAQINSIAGAVEQNGRKVIEILDSLGQVQTSTPAASKPSTLVVFPELCLVGYPPRDLLSLRSLRDQEKKALESIMNWTKSRTDVGVLIGHTLERPTELPGRSLWNAASLLSGGKILGQVHKRRIPNYDIFDELRFFEADPHPQPILHFDGIALGVQICEDAWDEVTPFFSDQVLRYSSDSGPHWNSPEIPNAFPDLIVNLSASPFHMRKIKKRLLAIQKLAQKTRCPVAYVNAVGAHDDILFDGGSFFMSADGAVTAQAPQFCENQLEIDISRSQPTHSTASLKIPLKSLESFSQPEWQHLCDAICLGISDFVSKNKMRRVHLGLSGGIDSALVAALAVRALGSDNVSALYMPSRWNSPLSETLARDLSQALQISLKIISIDPLIDAFQNAIPLNPGLGLENIQARIRANLLMWESGEQQSLLLATGNKDELAMGYSTLYGDLAGALCPIGDLYKHEVYGLAHYLNHIHRRENPKSSHDLLDIRLFTRAPSAELAPNQIDQDSLPPYPILDTFLEWVVEKGLAWSSLSPEMQKAWDQFLSPFRAADVIAQLHRNEFKRHQAPPILKLRPRSFGSGWRMPIAKDLTP